MLFSELPRRCTIKFGIAFVLLYALYPQHGVCLAPPDQSLVGSTVILDYGSFTGLQNTITGITYFRGIRYAEAPVGNLRWRAPVSPPISRLGMVDVMEFGDACIATVQTTEVDGTSEDCLFGNVYVPINTTTRAQLPVLVYFHGGGFQGGSARTFPPELILQSSQKPLILVTFQYRLGQFGFLGGLDVKANGALNAGFLDQRAALRWVQRYIHNFGGDKQKVTIWGQSAGAGSTMFHLIANGGNNEDLFRAVMGDSPSLSYMPAYNDTYIEEIYKKFVGLTACTRETSAETLRCLRAAPVSDLIRAGSSLLTDYPRTLYLFAPIIDGTLLSTRPVDAFSSASPSIAPQFSRIPLLFGSNIDEGAGWSSTLPDPLANTSMPNSNEETVVRFLQGQWATMPRIIFDDAMDADTVLYPLESYGDSVSLQGQQMYGEARYICTAGLITGGGSIAGVQGSYQYSYHNPHLGSRHSAEIVGFFSPPANANAQDLALYQTMREYWTSFVTDGRPTSRSGATWEPVSSANGSPRLLLHPEGVVMEDINEALNGRCGYWHRTWPRMNN